MGNAAKNPNICGIRKRTFFVTLFGAIALVALAIGLGVGLGVRLNKVDKT